MSQKFGYIVDLAEYKFDESTNTTWIMGAPLGDYTHPLYGDINMTPERIKAFADSVTNKVRGQDIEIDYDHKAKLDHAAGWVKAAEARSDGLWLQVEWTPNALRMLKEKEYRYFSPEYEDEWTHPSTKVKHLNVLFGGGLTNRPYLKGIMPINLSEFTTSADEQEGSKNMTPEQIKKYALKFGLKEDATEEQVFAAMDAATLAPPVVPEPPAVTAQLSEMQKEIDNLKKLSETNPAVAPMVKLMETQQEYMKQLSDDVAKSRAAVHLSEMASKVKMLDEKANGKGWAIPKPVLEAGTKFLSEHSTTKEFTDSFYDFAEKLLDAQLVQLGEVRPGTGGGSGDEAKQFTDKVKKLSEDNKDMSYVEAVEQVSREHPELFDAYRNASYSKPKGE